ncbi:MAG TPA: hypothetical protein V6C72_16935 [Chroococcales cyanobacterium]
MVLKRRWVNSLPAAMLASLLFVSGSDASGEQNRLIRSEPADLNHSNKKTTKKAFKDQLADAARVSALFRAAVARSPHLQEIEREVSKYDDYHKSYEVIFQRFFFTRQPIDRSLGTYVELGRPSAAKQKMVWLDDQEARFTADILATYYRDYKEALQGKETVSASDWRETARLCRQGLVDLAGKEAVEHLDHELSNSSDEPRTLH